MCCLALSSGIRELLIKHRIPLAKVLLELRERRLLLHQIGINHVAMGEIVCDGTVDVLQGEYRKRLGETFGRLPLPKGLDEGVERHAGACYPIAAFTVLYICFRFHKTLLLALLPLLCWWGEVLVILSLVEYS